MMKADQSRYGLWLNNVPDVPPPGMFTFPPRGTPLVIEGFNERLVGADANGNPIFEAGPLVEKIADVDLWTGSSLWVGPPVYLKRSREPVFRYDYPPASTSRLSKVAAAVRLLLDAVLP